MVSIQNENYAALIRTMSALGLTAENQERIANIVREQRTENTQRDENNENTEFERAQKALNKKCKNKKNNTVNLKNLIITAPTQTGKTGVIINLIKGSDENCLSIISCDNKNDQLNQLVERLEKNGLVGHALKSSTNASVKKLIEKFKKAKENGKKIVIVVLNNDSQVKKLSDVMVDLILKLETTSFHVFHDEADLVNKHDHANTIPNDKKQPKVHVQWQALFAKTDRIETLSSLKRIWVSATPENCSILHEVSTNDFFVMPSNENYMGVSQHIQWDGQKEDENEDEDEDNHYNEDLAYEVRRIKDTGSREAILYCTTRLNINQSQIAVELSKSYNCYSVCYNGRGIDIYKNGIFENRSYQSISSAFAFISTGYNGPVIVVGHELMNRGISFISDKEGDKKPLTATVMFYEGSDTACAVNIVQRIGRITGTSRPDIQRRVVYCNEEIYKCYKDYLDNQKTIYENINNPENSGKHVRDIFKDTLGLRELGRNIDRPVLKTVNQKYKEATTTESDQDSAYGTDIERSNTEDNIIKKFIIKNVKNMMRPSNKTNVAEIFKLVYHSDNNKATVDRVRQELTELNAHYTFIDNLTDRGHINRWYLLFKSEGEYIGLTNEALDATRQ